MAKSFREEKAVVGGLDDARTNAHTPGLGRAVQVDMLIMKY
jgi:hypothetical protein